MTYTEQQLRETIRNADATITALRKREQTWMDLLAALLKEPPVYRDFSNDETCCGYCHRAIERDGHYDSCAWARARQNNMLNDQLTALRAAQPSVSASATFTLEQVEQAMADVLHEGDWGSISNFISKVKERLAALTGSPREEEQ
jgi:cytochrome c553